MTSRTYVLGCDHLSWCWYNYSYYQHLSNFRQCFKYFREACFHLTWFSISSFFYYGSGRVAELVEACWGTGPKSDRLTVVSTHFPFPFPFLASYTYCSFKTEIFDHKIYTDVISFSRHLWTIAFLIWTKKKYSNMAELFYLIGIICFRCEGWQCRRCLKFLCCSCSAWSSCFLPKVSFNDLRNCLELFVMISTTYLVNSLNYLLAVDLNPQSFGLCNSRRAYYDYDLVRYYEVTNTIVLLSKDQTICCSPFSPTNQPRSKPSSMSHHYKHEN